MIWVALIAGIVVCVLIMYAVWRLVRKLEGGRPPGSER
jgi:hypothetical protein